MFFQIFIEAQFTLLHVFKEKLTASITNVTLNKNSNCLKLIQLSFFTDILKNHILDMTFCSGAVAGENAKTSTFNLMGEKMLFQRVAIKRSPQNENQTEETTTRSQAEDEEQNDYDILINDKAKIVEFDIMGKNGVLHVIDSILPTESGLPISTMLGNHNLTTFKKLMEFGNFDETLDNLMNATYFVPSDNAFAESVRGKYWLEQLENSPQNLKNNPELKQFLNYHIAQPLTKTCDLSEKMLDTLEGESLRVNLYTTVC